MNPSPNANEGGTIAQDPAEWFKHHSYDHRQLSDLKQFARRKRELGLSVSGTNSAQSKRGAGCRIYDPVGQKIGSAEEIFVNRSEEPEYVRVRIGLFGRKSVLIPVQFAEVDNERQTLVLK